MAAPNVWEANQWLNDFLKNIIGADPYKCIFPCCLIHFCIILFIFFVKYIILSEIPNTCVITQERESVDVNFRKYRMSPDKNKFCIFSVFCFFQIFIPNISFWQKICSIFFSLIISFIRSISRHCVRFSMNRFPLQRSRRSWRMLTRHSARYTEQVCFKIKDGTFNYLFILFCKRDNSLLQMYKN